MEPTRRAALSLVLTLVLAVAAPAATADTSTLRGKVTDFYDKSGLEGVTVMVHDVQGRPLDDAVTFTQGPSGTYSITDLPAGEELQVKFELEGYDAYPTWETCRLPARAEVNVELLPVNKAPSEIRGFFVALGERSAEEVLSTWQRLSAIDPDDATRDTVLAQAADALGAATVNALNRKAGNAWPAVAGPDDAVLAYETAPDDRGHDVGPELEEMGSDYGMYGAAGDTAEAEAEESDG